VGYRAAVRPRAQRRGPRVLSGRADPRVAPEAAAAIVGRMSTAIAVRHNPAAHRYEAEVEGHLAVAEYTLEGDRQVFTHTFVPPELRGRGVAEQLVRTALEEARAAGRKVVPLCSYVAVFIRRNPEFQPLVAAAH